jgi:hypothetical protein
MGKFQGYLPLKDRVCRTCNGQLGKLDEQLCNSGFEAFFRRFLGIKGRRSHNAVNPFYRGSSGGGRLEMVSKQPEDGKEIQLEAESGGTVRQLRHVSLVAEDDSVYIIPITDGMTPKQFRAKFDALGVKRFKEGDVYADSSEISWVQQLMATLKFDKQTDWTARNVGPTVYNGAAIKVVVGNRYFRDIAKIGFHYFLTKMPQFTGAEPCFGDLRAFIKSESSIAACERFVSYNREQISLDIYRGHRLKNWGHMLAAQFDYLSLTAKVQLFVGPEFLPPVYTVKLGTNPSRIGYSEAAADFFAYYPEAERSEFDGEVSPMSRLRR